VFPTGSGEKLAYQKWSRILSCFLREALREREQISLGQIEFHPFDTVQGKEDDAGGEGFAILDLRGQIFKRRNVDATQADAFASEVENCPPEFFPRIGQGRDYEHAWTKGTYRLWFLIEASAGHNGIVVCQG
jgi:hypothetical protein